MPSKTVHKSINRLITKGNLVVMDDEAGDLVIVDPGDAGDCVDALELGKNILSGSAFYDASNLYSRYVVLGQHAGTDADFGRTAAEDKGIIDSNLVKRNRLLVIKDKGQSTNMTCGKRVVDRLLGIKDNLLVSKLSFSLSGHGMITSLTVLPRDGYKREAAASTESTSTEKETPWLGVVK